MTAHADLIGAELHQAFNYWQETDPGAVGYKATWFKESIKTIYVRDSANLNWESVLASSSTNALPSGTTATEVQAAIDAASNGDIIVLPNETIIQDVPLLIDGKNVSIWGSGSASCLEHRGDLSQFGSTIALAIRNCSDVQIAYLEMKANRAYTTSATRTNFIFVGEGTDNLNIHHNVFTGCTSNVVNIDKITTSAAISNINFHHNIVNEWFEQVFAVAAAGTGFYCCFNNCVTTAAGLWPSFLSVEPFGFFIGLERGGGGRVSNALCAYNTFDLSGLGSGDAINAAAIALSDGDQDGVGISWHYDKVYIIGNRTVGGRAGVRFQRMRKEGEPTTTFVLDNTFENALLEPIRFETSGYNMDDTVIIRGNRWILNSGGGITEGYNSADIGVLNLASYADNLDVGAAPTRNYIFNASDNDNVYSTTNAVDGQNVTLWVEESATWEWYEGAYTFLGVPITANGPTYKTVTPLMALPCLAFNGTTEHLPGILRYSAAGGGTSGSFKSFDGVFQDDAKTIIMAIYVEGATANSASAWLNHGIFCDQQDGFGIFVRNNSGTYKVQAFSWHYPTASVVELTISLNTTYVVCARHDGVNLYLSLDGGTESSIAALPSTRLEGRWLLGANGQLTQFFQGRIGEIKTWNTCLSGGTLATEISTMTTKW